MVSLASIGSVPIGGDPARHGLSDDKTLIPLTLVSFVGDLPRDK